jgi:hypothetical protein
MPLRVKTKTGVTDYGTTTTTAIALFGLLGADDDRRNGRSVTKVP